MKKPDEEIISDDDIIKLWPGDFLRKCYKHGDSVEEAIKKTSDKLSKPDAIVLSGVIVRAFYEHWDKHGVSKKPIRVKAGELMEVLEDEAQE